jgi:hypothetical protein
MGCQSLILVERQRGSALRKIKDNSIQRRRRLSLTNDTLDRNALGAWVQHQDQLSDPVNEDTGFHFIHAMSTNSG